MKANTKRSKSKGAQSTVTKLRQARAELREVRASLAQWREVAVESQDQEQRAKAALRAQGEDFGRQLDNARADQRAEADRSGKAQEVVNSLRDLANQQHDTINDLKGKVRDQAVQASAAARTISRLERGLSEASAALVKTVTVATFHHVGVDMAATTVQS